MAQRNRAASDASAGLDVLRRSIDPNHPLRTSLSVLINVNWDIVTSLRPDRDDFNPQQFSLAHQTVLVGDGEAAETTTPIRYINARWPNLGSPFVSVLESHLRDVLKSGTSSDARDFDSWPLNDLSVDYFAWQAPIGIIDRQEAAVFEVRGHLEALAELIDAIAWLSACFRCYQKRQIYLSYTDVHLGTDARPGQSTITISPRPLTVLHRSPWISWHHLMSEAVCIPHTSYLRKSPLLLNKEMQGQPSQSLKLSITELMKLVRTRSQSSFILHKGSTLLLGQDCLLIPTHKREDGSISWMLFITKQKYPEIPATSTTHETWDSSRPCWKQKSEQVAFEKYNDRTKLALETIDARWPLAKDSRSKKPREGGRARFPGWDALEDAPAHYVCSWT